MGRASFEDQARVFLVKLRALQPFRAFCARASLCAPLVVCLLASAPVRAQETSAQGAALRSAAMSRLPKDAARRLFGTVASAAPGEPMIVGEYWKGCYRGGAQLAPVGDHWQVMRLSRNRNWGHPVLVAFLQKFAGKAAAVTGWPGILVGDLSQPRGGPMITGHASHQLGIEADIWLRPMPKRPFTPEEIEQTFSTDLVRADGKDVDPKLYTPKHLALLRAAAQEPGVARVFVNAAIKKALCRDAGADRGWLQKIRPAAGHTYHFHIRLACPKGEPGCIDQAPPNDGDGCGKELNYWLAGGVSQPKPGGSGKALRLSSMPKACQELVSTAEAKKKEQGVEHVPALTASIDGGDAATEAAQARDKPSAPPAPPARPSLRR